MKKTTLWIIVGIVVVIGIIIAVSKKSPPTSGETIKIGANLALTDFGASWAENELKGAQLAVKEINNEGGVMGRPLQLVVEDNQSQSKGSVSATNKLISVDKVSFLLTGWSDQTEPVIPIISQNKVLTITVSAGAAGITKGSPYLFRTWPSDAIAVDALVKYAKEEGYKKVAIANSIGAWEATLVESFKTLAPQNGITVTDQVAFAMDVPDFKTQIAKLKASAPDAIFIPITSGPVERFVKQSGDLALNIPLLFPVDVTAIGVPEKAPASSLAYLTYATYAPSTEKFVAAYKKEYGVEPGVSADTAYDAVHMLAQAIEKAGTTDVEKVKESFSTWDGASGQITFDQDRDRSTAEVILMGFDGKTTTPVKLK